MIEAEDTSNCTSLGLDPADNVNTANFTAAGQTPASLLSHTIKREYVILGVTPAEFIEKHGSAAFDFTAVRRGFAHICENFEEPLAMEVKSKAVEFCSKMIYEVGPEARQVRKKAGDKTWRFLFVYNHGGKLQTKVAFVSTYKADEASYKIEAEPTKITLSVKTASLLAIIVLNKLNEISMSMVPQVALLSPLAGSVSSKDDIPKIAQALGATSTSIVQVINASSQSGGHYLKDRKLHIAIVATIVATRGVKDKKMKDAIIGKTIKQYLNAKKEFKMRHFEVYAEFGHGVPSNLSPDNLLKMFDDIQKMTPIQAAIAARATRQNIQVLAPAPAPVVQPPASGAAGTSAGGATGTSTAKGAVAKARPPTPK